LNNKVKIHISYKKENNVKICWKTGNGEKRAVTVTDLPLLCEES